MESMQDDDSPDARNDAKKNVGKERSWANDFLSLPQRKALLDRELRKVMQDAHASHKQSPPDPPAKPPGTREGPAELLGDNSTGSPGK